MLNVTCNNINQLQVVDRNNGKPVVGVSVHLKSTHTETGYVVMDKYYETDKQGFVNPDTHDNLKLDITVSNKSDTLVIHDYYYYNSRQRRERNDDVTAKAGKQWDKLESIFEERIAKALQKLGVPSSKDVQSLMDRIDALQAQVGARATGTARKAAGKTGSRTAAKAAPMKSAAGKRTTRAAKKAA